MEKIKENKPYFYDGSLLLAEKVGSQIQKIYINDGEGIIGMVRPIYDGSNQLTHYQRLYYLYDSLGSVSAVTGEHGLPLQNYTYSPFGTCLNVTNDPINSLQFIGRYGGYLDNDTGLTYFWHRWYDSKDGRWISRDPIGIGGGINLYGYVKNQPVKFIDKTGFDTIVCIDCITNSQEMGKCFCEETFNDFKMNPQDCGMCAVTIALAAVSASQGRNPNVLDWTPCMNCGGSAVYNAVGCVKKNCKVWTVQTKPRTLDNWYCGDDNDDPCGFGGK